MDIECSCGKEISSFLKKDNVEYFWCKFCGALHISNQDEMVYRERVPHNRPCYFLLKSKDNKRKKRMEKEFKEGI